MQHPGVAEACVVPRPHPELLEVPRAYVVLSDKTVTSEELTKLVAEKLYEGHNLAGGVAFLDALPKLPNGKVARSEVKEWAKQSV